MDMSAVKSAHSPKGVRNRRTGSNIPKSCKQCRRSKQRCDIPNRTAIQASEEPQPVELACHRCKVLQLPCVVDYPLDESNASASPSQLPPITPSTQMLTMSGEGIQQQQQQQYSHPPRKQRRRSSASPPSSSSSYRRDVPFRATHQARGKGSRESHKDVHLFDPDFQGQVIQDSSGNVADRNVDMTAFASWAETDTVTAIKHLRPFPYLARLCSIQPGFFVNVSGMSNDAHAETYSVTTSVNLQRHASVIDWRELNTHLHCFQLCLPFLEYFHPEGHPLERVGIWLATCLYLASTRTTHTSLHVDLLLFLRQQIENCMSRGPSSMGEVAALVVMSMYEPLLITPSIDKINIDGSHMLVTATSALQALDSDVIPSQMRAFDMTNPSQSPLGLLRQCSLVMSVALYSNYQIFMGSTNRQLPFLRFGMDDIDEMESFCMMVIQWHRERSHAECASILLILLFRYRSLSTFERVNLQQCTHLNSLIDAISEQGEEVLNEMVMKLHDTAASIFTSLQALRHVLVLDNDRRNMYLDYVELDIKQIHTTCQANIQDTCLLLVESSLGKTTNLSTLAQNVLPDPKKLGFMRIVGRARTASCRKVAILFGNFADRWSEAEGTSTNSGQYNQILAPPPAYTCAMILPDIKSLCDAAAGYLHLGAAPKDCLQEAQLDLAATLVRAFAKALLTFAPANKSTSPLILSAKRHCDLFQLVAHVASRTSHAIHEWTSNSKGLRLTTNFTFQFASRNSNADNSTSSSKKSKDKEDKRKQSERAIQKISVPYLTQPSREDDIPSGIPDADSSTIQTGVSNTATSMNPNDFVYFENLLQEVLSAPVIFPTISHRTL